MSNEEIIRKREYFDWSLKSVKMGFPVLYAHMRASATYETKASIYARIVFFLQKSGYQVVVEPHVTRNNTLEFKYMELFTTKKAEAQALKSGRVLTMI
jgi:hypothetical protein